ncbi:MAG: serine/threonine protein kinase [Pirellulales bacterium]|nr:serine/threonine protein kinase [Pirellulales bacterium]
MNPRPSPATAQSKIGSAVERVAAEIRSQAGGFDDPRIIEIVSEYEQALQAGDQPNRSEFLNRHPELAAAVATCLDGLDLVYTDKPQVSSQVHGPLVDDRHQPLETDGAPLGDFQIVRELARGGMGVVYEAIQLSLGRRVALKVLPFAATIDDRHLQRFKLEAQAAALLHHNHIVPVYAVGCERGVHYYAMQLIEGQSLSTVIRQLAEQESQRQPKSHSRSRSVGDFAEVATASINAQPSQLNADVDISIRPGIPQGDEAAHPIGNTHADESTHDVSQAVTGGFSLQSERFVRRAVRMIAQAGEALEHAHQAGVVHRDIKPANLMVDQAGRVWITDFGLAQIQADINLTRSGDMLGTLRYMSPEQAGGQKTSLDHRTDVYSLGATLYELLTLGPVFSGTTHQELLHQILNTEPRGLREKNRAVSVELETVVLKSLRKNADERYQSAAEFRDDLARFLEHQPVLARRPTLLERAKKWSRRHPSAVIAAGMMFAVVAIALFISNHFIREEQQKTNQAYLAEQQRANEAEQSFQQARDAVNALFQISEEELSGPGQDAARRRILEVVLSHYEQFIEQREDDPQSQAELAAARTSIEEILHELNAIQQYSRLRLLDSPAVQKELAITTEQATVLAGLASERRRRERAFFSTSEQSFMYEDKRQRRAALAAKHESKLAQTLRPEQSARFEQLVLQSMGLNAFKEPLVIETLELTQQQRKEIRELERSRYFGRGRNGPGPAGRGGRDRAGRGRGGQKRTASRRETERRDMFAQALKLLTVTQQEAWRELVGDSFHQVFEKHGNRRNREE